MQSKKIKNNKKKTLYIDQVNTKIVLQAYIHVQKKIGFEFWVQTQIRETQNCWVLNLKFKIICVFIQTTPIIIYLTFDFRKNILKIEKNSFI